MKIEFINFPFVFTNTGQRIEISKINQHPSVGALLKENGERYDVINAEVDENCVNGVCPIK